ncbi:MAG: ABC transporter substrate-binding protein [Halobacteriales archaeon]
MASNDPDESNSSRRWFLKTVGAGTAVGIAGCTGGGDGGDGEDEGEDTETEGDSGGGSTDTPEPEGTETEESDMGGKAMAEFNRSHVGPLTHLDVHALNDSTVEYMEMAYDQLVDYAKGDPSTIKPALATDWESANGGREWVFTLREGVTFDDGTTMDAYAVKRSLERAKQLDASQSKPFDWIESIEENGDYEVQINAAGDGFGPAPAALTFVIPSIVNPNVIDEHWEEKNLGHEYFKNNLHGTGPYKLQNDEWEKGETSVWVLKDSHWRAEHDDLPDNLAVPEKANLGTVNRMIVREAQTRKLQLRKGDVDFTTELTFQQRKAAVDASDAVRMYSAGPSMKNHYVFLHNQREPTSDVNFRKALSYATDYESVAKNVVQNAKPWGRPWADINWPNMDRQYRRDLDKAKEFLDKSVYDGRELEWITSTGPTSNNIAQAMTAQWKNDLGINIKHRGEIPWSQAYERLVDQEAHADVLNYFGWPDYIDPNGHAIRYWGDYWPPAGWNSGYYKNERYDELFVKARSTGKRSEREKLYSEMQDILMDEAPFIWPVQRIWKQPVRKEIKNFSYTPGNLDYLRQHQFWKTTQ